MSTPNTTILIVDDDEATRVLLARNLEQRGYQILLAQDGHIAMQMMDRASIDMVLLDVRMPGFDGLEVLRSIRKNAATETLPVIMVSVVNDSEKTLEAFDLGASDYITKPFEIPIFLARVQAQLRMHQAKRPKPPPPPAESAAESNAPVILAGQYRIEERIGEGGFGAVFRAVRISDGVMVAVKVLQTALMPSQKALTRFQIEGITTRRIKHPNAVEVLDSGVTSEGMAFLVMELLTGTPLDALIKQGPISCKRAAEIIISVCDVLSFAHKAKIIHRDLKPSNIFLHRTPIGHVAKVLDFGLAKIVDESFGENFTREGQVLGTVSYVAPERLRGLDYDGRSDIYSIGATLYELTVGSPPFTTATPDPAAVAMMHLNKKPVGPREFQPKMSHEMEALILAMLEKDPKKRPALADIMERLRPEADGPDLNPAPARKIENKETGGFGGTMLLTEVADEPKAAESAKPAAPPEEEVVELGESSIVPMVKGAPMVKIPAPPRMMKPPILPAKPSPLPAKPAAPQAMVPKPLGSTAKPTPPPNAKPVGPVNPFASKLVGFGNLAKPLAKPTTPLAPASKTPAGGTPNTPPKPDPSKTNETPGTSDPKTE